MLYHRVDAREDQFIGLQNEIKYEKHPWRSQDTQLD